MKKSKLALLFLSACLLCTGCIQSHIKEDEIREDLVKLDPQAGLTKEITFVCYSQLADEPYLAGINRTVLLRSGERAEKAMIEAVISAPAAISGEAGQLFPEGTEIVDLSIDGTILYLTLSKDFIDQSELTDLQTQIEKDYKDGKYSQTEFTRKTNEALQAFALRRKMAIYALANTIAGYSSRIRLMLLIDTQGNGTGMRLTRSEMFLQADSLALLEPLGYDEELVVTAEKMASLVFDKMQNKEYESLYPLFMSAPSEILPDYESFEKSIRAAGELKSYQISAASLQGGDERLYNVSITLTGGKGTDRFLENRHLIMRNDNGLFRPDYASFIQLLEER